MTKATVYDDSELLNYAVQTGIISLDTMLNDMAIMERKEILAQHVYSITTTTDKSGKEIFSTYYPTRTVLGFSDEEILLRNWKMSL